MNANFQKQKIDTVLNNLARHVPNVKYYMKIFIIKTDNSIEYFSSMSIIDDDIVSG